MENDSEHTKGLVCRNCPIAYVAEVTEAHSPDESGLCACDKAYQPAVLTTDKYDVDKDGVYDKVYEISNADQLYWFANKINNENYTSGNINAVLTADIVVNENVLKSDGTLNDGSLRIGHRLECGLVMISIILTRASLMDKTIRSVDCI